MPDLITSTQNPLVKRIRSIKTRKGRQREGSFWAEGIHIVLEALEAEWAVDRLVWCPDLLTSDAGRAAVEDGGCEAVALSEDVFRRVSDRENPTGLGATIKMRHKGLGAITAASDVFCVVLDRAQDPGNVGTVIRTAGAAGADAVVLVGASADPYDPRCVRASMGSLFSVPVVAEGKHQGLIEWATERAVRLVASSAKGEVNYKDALYGRPLGLMLGSEQHGLDAELIAVADLTVQIPMVGRASSLNLAAAAAVLCYAVAGDG